MKRKLIIATLICTVLILASGTIAYAEGAEELIADLSDAIEDIVPGGEEDQESEQDNEESEEAGGTDEYVDTSSDQETVQYEDEYEYDSQDTEEYVGETTYYGSGYDDNLANQLFEETNAYRQENGVAPLTRMEDTAYADTRCMEVTYQWSHERPGGQAAQSEGENLAMTGMISSPHSVVYDLWANSEFHRINMLDGAFTSMSVSVYINSNGAAYYVQCFYF